MILLLFVVGSTDSAFAERFKGYGSCGDGVSESGVRDPEKTCHLGGYPAGVFIAKKRDNVRYKFCFDGPTGKKCRRKTTTEAGKLSTIGFLPDGAGRYRLTWHVPGEGQVEHWSMRIVPH